MKLIEDFLLHTISCHNRKRGDYLEKLSEKLIKQYEDLAQVIESEGLGYGLSNGYFNSNTDDEELNEAIIQAEKSINKIEKILGPYMF